MGGFIYRAFLVLANWYVIRLQYFIRWMSKYFWNNLNLTICYRTGISSPLTLLFLFLVTEMIKSVQSTTKVPIYNWRYIINASDNWNSDSGITRRFFFQSLGQTFKEFQIFKWTTLLSINVYTRLKKDVWK